MRFKVSADPGSASGCTMQFDPSSTMIRLADDTGTNWTGSLSIFEKNGFAVVKRNGKSRAIVRRDIPAA